MDQSRLTAFKQQFEAFKNTEEYTYRRNQSAIVPLLKKFIWETLKNDPIKNEHLTGFIQALRWKASHAIFEKYVHQNITNPTVAKQIIRQFNSQEFCGYTAAGKQAVNDLTKRELATVRQFLLDAFKVKTTVEAKQLVTEFEQKKVPIVKTGIYSPWLHYVDPTLFPVINNTHKTFMEWIGVPYSYPAAIDLFTNLKEESGETHLGMLDAYAYRFEDATGGARPPGTPSSSSGASTGSSATQNSGALNTILYGPPGTGKTYNSIDKAVEIATGKSGSHEENKQVFDRLRNEGQIEFVTFHQNFTYEDFVVGIRPDIEFEQLRFKPHRGIFYEIARRARENYFAAQEHRAQSQGFDEILAEFLIPLEADQEVEVKTVQGKSFWITDVSSSSLPFRKASGGTHHSLSIETLREMVEGTRELKSGLITYYRPVINILKRMAKESSQNVPAVTLKNYVLIIDEINRANISRVFGELITLLETV